MKLYSRFAREIDPVNPRPEYPRMQMKRDSFMNLNGIWEYQITDKDGRPQKDKWHTVVVPFPLGSLLSGSDEQLQPGEALWYRRTFSFRPGKKRVMLNFEAVDCLCEVYLNGRLVGSHQGGYAPFSTDITAFVKYQNALMVRVIDDSDQGSYAYGKQALQNSGMFYTPQSGIWGTVWIEELPEHAVRDLQITSEYDTGTVSFHITGDFHQALITIFENDEPVQTGLTTDGRYSFQLDHVHSWSPEDPFLYQVEIQTEDDLVESYFGMRKFSSGYDAAGIKRFMLNNQPYFFSGLLDQGYSCDGGYAYPSEEAMLFEITTAKKMGFNCLRKHVKVECRRWYYLCDKLGMLVMQDMPSGGYDHYDVFVMGVLPQIGFRHLKDTGKTKFGRNDAVSEEHYRYELDEMMKTVGNAVSVFAYVPFNEGWGQFDASELCAYIKQKDPERLVDHASGWFDQGCGDFDSVHDYFFPYHVSKKDERIHILSEFGGYSFVEAGHSCPEKVYGYRIFKNKPAYNEAVFRCFETMVESHVKDGLSGCIYTELCDIEDECNGIISADREVIKLDMHKMRRINERIRRRIKK